ncbi:hypothetical protein EOD42_03140 [Rhodovarius crocodyli]|uniref:Uncharacterized protein n=1 Tax=Rhodovarius crocodyli TaxID=1979269 RepID=A0A437MNA3_9PROT|nr:hypothetical protein [Rhodovarius crocodyli]RVT99117.1 hypothetical protein EOD42_03140 [Rhodovarius crocodyli]
MADFLPVLTGACIGAGVSVSAILIKASLDSFISLCDAFCEKIEEAADLASEYWLIPAVSLPISAVRAGPPGQQPIINEDDVRIRLLESRIVGLQTKIGLIGESIIPGLPELHQLKITRSLVDFYEALSGGTFKARDGNIHEVFAGMAQHHSAVIVSTVRSALRERHTFRGMARHRTMSLLRAIGGSYTVAATGRNVLSFPFPIEFIIVILLR